MKDAPTICARAAPWALVGLTLAVFSPALGAGWMGYDDDWLVQFNPVLGSGEWSALGVVFGAFDLESRLALGAEFLPVRDLVVWLLHGVLGLSVAWLHAAQLALYTVAALWVARALLAIFGATESARTLWLAAALFAVHPVHAESVVWLAGLKDSLALLFSAGALAAYASPRGRGAWIVVATALACFSKAASVALPLLLLAVDYAMARRPRWGALAGAAAVAAAATATHAFVGGVVGMIAEPLGGSRLTAAASMLVALARYLGLSLFVRPHAVIYEVAPLGFDAPAVLASAALLVALAAAAALGHRRGARWPLFAGMIFVFALAPVSQVLAPLQNHMADRYLVLAVLGPMVALAFSLSALLSRERLRRMFVPVALTLVALVACLGFLRARVYADPVLLFAEATERTRESVTAPYQLGMALQSRGAYGEAELAFRLAMARDGLRTDAGRRAGNNLGTLLHARGETAEALALYRELRARYPDDPRVLWNLIQVLRAGDRPEGAEEAAALLVELRARFPRYEEARRLERHGPRIEPW